MPYIPCEEAWCDYPEWCQSDHWVPDTEETMIRKWTDEEVEAAAAVIFWQRNAEQLRQTGVRNFTHLVDISRSPKLHKDYIWSPGDGSDNDPPVYVEDIFMHEGVAIKSDLLEALDKAATLQILANFGGVILPDTLKGTIQVVAWEKRDGSLRAFTLAQILTADEIAQCQKARDRRRVLAIVERRAEDFGIDAQFLSAIVAAVMVRSGIWP